jgi:bifunctional non-homologous end joining protein LigD
MARGATAASLPQWIKPQLARLAERAPAGAGWLHEIKLDGYRMHARLAGGKAQLLTRLAGGKAQGYPARRIRGAT